MANTPTEEIEEIGMENSVTQNYQKLQSLNNQELSSLIKEIWKPTLVRKERRRLTRQKYKNKRRPTLRKMTGKSKKIGET